MPAKTCQIAARIDDDLKNWIYEFSEKHSVSVSDIIIYALENLRGASESTAKIKTKNRLDKLMNEDGHMYVVVQNNGELKLERVEKKVVNFS